ncbi:transcriptional regulator, LacI family [Sanguibacter gelidistatuariae]|uniref:Transcriptional regulator, LacI family n=1 Tax=Sanguibacter gelidistatuariae TaxID=1814289 RepID=A0A1G6GW92_9MICO|nr:LacI family DNA-binding transcriptional regulator [Sanguibacter gelidistatuariae]SDB86143.1 transcriptional regulator, LacI family [Sanguibacter gelidistatuariae]
MNRPTGPTSPPGSPSPTSPPSPARPARPTLADVAAVAGVSAKSVSNVLLERPGVSAATRERVLAAVAQVGYAVNPAGRGLVSGRTGRIAVVVPMLYQPYFAEIAERLILALEAEGLTTTLRIAPDAAAERDAVVGVTTPDVDGVIICPHEFISSMIDGVALTRPVVQLGGGPIDRLDCVVMGEYEGAYAAARHLLKTGRRRIALLWNSPDGEEPGGDRYDGYRQAISEAGIEIDPALFASGSDWDRRVSGYEAMVGLLRSGVRFDAALCVNDAIAVGALRALRSHGRTVPGDVAVTGFDATDEGEFTTPALTSVSPRKPEMVARAVSMLVERLGGYDGPGRHVRTGADLIVRASSVG